MRFWALLAAVLAILSAGQVQALSCLATDAAASFDKAVASEARYIVVVGQFAFDPDALPEEQNNATVPPVALKSRFTGRGLTTDGFTTPLSLPVTLDVSCAGPWCGALTPDMPHLAFLERRPGGYHLDVGPCPAWVFSDPSDAILAELQACMVREGCTPAP